MPTAEKGARVSTHITLPGNYIVLMPNFEVVTVSQKISSNEEKDRLVQIIKKIIQSKNKKAYFHKKKQIAI